MSKSNYETMVVLPTKAFDRVTPDVKEQLLAVNQLNVNTADHINICQDNQRVDNRISQRRESKVKKKGPSSDEIPPPPPTSSTSSSSSSSSSSSAPFFHSVCTKTDRCSTLAINATHTCSIAAAAVAACPAADRSSQR